jgi:rhamnulokinase
VGLVAKNLTVGAIDLGAESGRVAHVDFDGTSLDLSVVHRFLHTPSDRNGRSHWNMDHIWSEIQSGLAALADSRVVRSLGVDTFGVDYGLIGPDNTLLEDPVTYRESARQEAFARAITEVPVNEFYRQTGSQVLPINTIFSLVAERDLRPDLLDQASYLLMLADVFHHKLSGSTVTERTTVSTSGMYDMAKDSWAFDLINQLNIPRHLFPEVVRPGTELGRVIGDVATSGLSDTEVIMPAAHDTASAVASIPGVDQNCLYISSGTWSLVGVITPTPVISAETLRFNLTNEAGYPDNVRVLRNLMGLWPIQECRRVWAKEGDSLGYAELMDMAAHEPALVSIVDPADTAFLSPGDMPRRIQDYCKAAGFPVPQTKAQIVRVVIDSLALSYRIAAEDIQQATGVSVTEVRVVGGGVNNTLLQQATADATGLPVITGSAEATVLGNAMIQLISLGEIASLEQGWEVISQTVSEKTYLPQHPDRYTAMAQAFRNLQATVADQSS